MNLADLPALLWPLVTLLLALVIFRKLEAELRPIVVAVVNGLADHARRHAAAYALGAMIATAASLQEMYSVAKDMHWDYLAAFARVLQPGLVGLIAYLRPPPSQSGAKSAPASTSAPKAADAVPATASTAAPTA